MSSILRIISTVGKNEVEESVIKATYNDKEKPKEKHVLRLIEIARSQIQYDVAELLTARLSNDSWQVVLKTLCVLHRICKDGETVFMTQFRAYSHTLNLGKLDRSTTLAWGHSRMIRAYAEYLAEKLYVFKVIGTSGERFSQREIQLWINDLSMSDLMKYLPLIQQQFDLLLKIRIYIDDNEKSIHPIATTAFKLLIIDAARLHSILHVTYLRLVESASTLRHSYIKTGIESYKNFIEQNKLFERWANDLEQHNLVSKDYLPISMEELSQTSGPFLQVMSTLLNAKGQDADGNNNQNNNNNDNNNDHGEVRNLTDLLGDDINLVVSPVTPTNNVSPKKKKKKKKKKLKKSESVQVISSNSSNALATEKKSQSDMNLFDLSSFDDTFHQPNNNNNNNNIILSKNLNHSKTPPVSTTNEAFDIFSEPTNNNHNNNNNNHNHNADDPFTQLFNQSSQNQQNVTYDPFADLATRHL